MPCIEVCLSPLLLPQHVLKPGTVVVVADILRATTSMLTAIHHGASAIIPVAEIEQARQFKLQGYPIAGERGGYKLDFADFGNNPLSFTPDQVQGKTLVFCTTNGTRAIQAVKGADAVFIGAFSNISRLQAELAALNSDVLIVCSGWNNQISAEDTLFAGALAERLEDFHRFRLENDSAFMATWMWRQAKTNLLQYAMQADHYQRLQRLGLTDGLDYCFLQDTAPVLAALDESGCLRLK